MLSIIICLYNTNKGLFKACLSSIANSILKDYETIVIDDGSSVDYSDIINEFGEIAHIKYFKTANHGTLSARLFGIQKSNGKYVCFVDSDDTVSFCYHQASLLEIENADIIVNDWAFQTNSAKFYYSEDSTINSNITSNNPLDLFFSKSGYEHSYYVLWNKIFKKETLIKAKKVIEKLSLPKLVYAEDVLISYFAFSYAKLIKNTHLGYYFYHKHTSQEMSISSVEKLENQSSSIKTVFDLILNDLKEKNLCEKYQNNIQKWKQLTCSSMLENSKSFKSEKTTSHIKKMFEGCDFNKKRILNPIYYKKILLPNNINEIDEELKSIYLKNFNELVLCENNSYTHKTLLQMKKIFNFNYEITNNKNSKCLTISNEKITLKQKIIHSYFISKIGAKLFSPSSKIGKFLRKKL